MFGVPVQEVTGTALKDCTFLDEVTRNLIFEQCLSVFNGGEAVEFTYYSPVFSSYLNVQRSKALNGILSITRDRTAQVVAEQERQRQSNLLRTIANASPTSIVLCEAVRDNQNKVHDFRLITVNEKTAQYLERPREEIESMTYCGLYPEIDANGLLDILLNVVIT